MGWESFGVVGFDLGPCLQGQTRIAKLKSAYNSLINGPRVINPFKLGCHSLTLKEGLKVESDHIRRFPAHAFL